MSSTFRWEVHAHPPINEVTFKEEEKEPILNVDDSGRFKGVEYSRKDNNKGLTTSKEPKKYGPTPKQVSPKELLPKSPPKKDSPTKANPKKDPPRKEKTMKKEKGKEVRLNIDIETTIGKINILIPLKEIAKLPEQQQQIKKSLGFKEEELPEDLQNIFICS